MAYTDTRPYALCSVEILTHPLPAKRHYGTPMLYVNQESLQEKKYDKTI